MQGRSGSRRAPAPVGAPRPAPRLGLNRASVGFGLATTGSPGNVSLQVNLDQVKSTLQIRDAGILRR